MITFGDNLYLWRVFNGLTQSELAKKSGIPWSNLNAIESGKREVTLTTLRSLALSFGVSPGVLVDGMPPLDFGKARLSRQSLESIIRLSLGKAAKSPAIGDKRVSAALSKIIINRINAEANKYSNILKERQSYIANWLLLKAAIGRDVLNNLLTRLDKYIELRRQ